MKRELIFCMCIGMLTACTNSIKNENNSEMLIRLNSEPTDCKFLYKLNTNVSVYSEQDAVRYMENRIVEQQNPGNAYMLVNKDVLQNEWVMFGPEHKYNLTAKVYDCSVK